VEILSNAYASMVKMDERLNHHSPSIMTETASNGKSHADKSEFGSMSVDALWNLHQKIETILAAKMKNELKELGKRLDQLITKATTGQREGRKSSNPRVANRRHYPSVFAEISKSGAAIRNLGRPG